MNRRQFLSSSMLSGFGLLATLSAASAFTEISCDNLQDTACRKAVEHREALARLEQSLRDRGLSEAERQKILATALCPVCGQPLIGS